MAGIIGGVTVIGGIVIGVIVIGGIVIGVIIMFDGMLIGEIVINVGNGGSMMITLGMFIGLIGPMSKHGNTIGGKLIIEDGITKLG